jgi:monoamine oxidase
VDVHARIVPTSIAVIGAGAAGLAAARTLKQGGIDTLLLEAQNRVGGRAYTLRSPGGLFPIELGAEFVHGSSPIMNELLRESGTQTIEVGGPDDVWDATQRVLDRVDLNAPDASVDAFLKTLGGDGVEQARMLIEGFDAALTADASIHGIAREWRGDANGAIARPANGYDTLVQYLARDVGGALLLDTRVERVDWSAIGVRIHACRYGEPFEIRARAAIITLPIGVLQNGVTFSPPLPQSHRRALEGIAMGPVVKVALLFRSVFWDEGFFQPQPQCGFPTIWSRMPQRAPVLIAWAGGDAVTRLGAKSADPVAAALDACAAAFPSTNVRAQLQAAYWHDWQADPYSRGAYSYLRVKGGDAREVLGQPVEQVLYFGGEAASGEYAGTVSGALESGLRAARAAAQALGRL